MGIHINTQQRDTIITHTFLGIKERSNRGELQTTLQWRMKVTIDTRIRTRTHTRNTLLQTAQATIRYRPALQNTLSIHRIKHIFTPHTSQTIYGTSRRFPHIFKIPTRSIPAKGQVSFLSWFAVKTLTHLYPPNIKGRIKTLVEPVV